MILGYCIYGADNKLRMFKNVSLTECDRYSDIYTINVRDNMLGVKRIKSNYSYTYDGFVIVSEQFKVFCERQNYAGLEFISFLQQGFYWFRIKNVVQYDTDARKTEFINFNERCSGYEEIIGANPVCLKEKSPLTDGFYRTDICFGSYAGKSPLYLVGESTKQKLEAAGFDEIDFEEILDKYDWQN